eukprot:TRINITY_DN1381_c0_g1_i2.p1 TRINITY_DN1381_c0_g1~~TRINITY_DN1381_c0_g1_i2.p1  ORF type:complete len:210 (-),score=20.85 TRINITY_DN1381_c0_g1_i2:2318-2947(-)
MAKIILGAYALLCCGHVAVTASAISVEDCTSVYQRCALIFEGYPEAPTFNLCSGSQRFAPPIKTRDGDELGVVHASQSGVEYLPDCDADTLRRLVEWGFDPSSELQGVCGFTPLHVLDSKLTPTHFKPVYSDGETHIEHATLEASSRKALQGACVRVPLSSWEVLGPDGSSHVVTADSDASCIAFKVGHTCPEDMPKSKRNLRGGKTQL